MKNYFLHLIVVPVFVILLAGCDCSRNNQQNQSNRAGVPIIFDTDIGNDVDDALAMGVIHALINRAECQLLAVTITKDNQYAALIINLINTFYGRPDIPIGMAHSGITPDDGRYLKEVILTKNEKGEDAFPHAIKPGSDVPEAVGLLRKTLAVQADGSVVVVQVGFSTNFARLMDSGPDDISPLSGMELIRKKVLLLSIMAGAFDPKYTHIEYNIQCDVPAAKKLIAGWPTPIVFSGFEIGDMIQYPSVNIQNDYDYVKQHPLKESYRYYRGLDKTQATFDLTSVLYAIRPNHGYFDLSEPGTVILDENGRTGFEPDVNGKHRYLKVSETQIAKVREALCLLCSEPPK
jgi:inosine-uridine nucleoside N-ribohydrolase